MLFVELLTGAAIAAPLGLAAARVGCITRGGAALGVLFGAIVYAAFFLAGFAVLGLALCLAVTASRIRRRRAALPPQDHDDDVRGAANVAANCVVGIAGAVVELTLLASPHLTAVWFVAGITAGASDTVASEIGRAFGGSPRAFPTWQRVAPGTAGAISTAGSIAGIAAAALIAAPGAALYLVPWSAIPAVVLACTLGSLVESALATGLEARGLVGNHTLNLLNTAGSAAIAVLIVG